MVGFYFDEKKGTLSSIGQVRDRTTLNGKAVFFFEDQSIETAASYQRGMLQGPRVHWTATGVRDYFCQYDKGKRSGVCCLLDDNAVRAVLEYNAGDLAAVHLVKGRHVKKSFTTPQAWAADTAAAAALAKADTIESALHGQEGEFRSSLTKFLNTLVGKKGGVFFPPSVTAPPKWPTPRPVRRAGRPVPPGSRCWEGRSGCRRR